MGNMFVDNFKLQKCTPIPLQIFRPLYNRDCNLLKLSLFPYLSRDDPDKPNEYTSLLN